MKNNTVICEECGFKYDGEQKICPMCGSKRRSRVGNSGSNPWERGGSTPKTHALTPKMIATMVAVTIVIVIIMVVLHVVRNNLYENLVGPVKEPAWSEEDSCVSAEVVPVLPDTPEAEGSSEAWEAEAEERLTDQEVRQKCQEIVEEYSGKMQEATPKLMEAFKSDVQATTDSRDLAALYNQKIEVLAELCNEGYTAIWELLFENGIEFSDTDYDKYAEYEQELDRVYEDETMKISDLYSDYSIRHAS